MPDRKRRVTVIEAGQPDADSLASLFILLGYGGLSISSYLHRHGYEVRYFPMFTSTRLDWGYIHSSDYVLISTMVHTAKLAYRIADAVRGRGEDSPVVILGGPHPTCEPEDSLEHCDFVATNEGEETSVELLRRLDAGPVSEGDLREISGLVFRGADGELIYTPRRKAMTEIDFALEPELIDHWPGIVGNFLGTRRLRFPFPVVQFSRGCPFSCSFCLGMRQLGQSYRTRRPESVLGDLERLHGLTRFPYGMFHDNDVAIRRQETKELLRRMIRAGVKIRRISAFTRVDSTSDEELWRLFDEAGIANVFFGVESLRQTSLDGFNKKTTVGGIHEAMERLDRYGVKTRIVASFVVGDSDDPLEELALIRDFWRRYFHRLQRVVIQPLMEYPYQQMHRGQHQLYGDEKFIHNDWDYFAGDYLVFYPKACPPSVLQREFLRTFRTVHGVPEDRRVSWDERLAQNLIRYTHRRKDRNLAHYIEYLERREKGKYDTAGALIPQRLEGDVKERDIDIGIPIRRPLSIPEPRTAPPRRSWETPWEARIAS